MGAGRGGWSRVGMGLGLGMLWSVGLIGGGGVEGLVVGMDVYDDGHEGGDGGMRVRVPSPPSGWVGECAACEYVVRYVAAEAGDPDKVEGLHAQMDEACAMLRRPQLAGECARFVDDNYAQIVYYLQHAGNDPRACCELLGYCRAADAPSETPHHA